MPYPWRVDKTPYKVLIAEVLLKRATRQSVAGEFHKFIQRFPDFCSIYKTAFPVQTFQTQSSAFPALVVSTQ